MASFDEDLPAEAPLAPGAWPAPPTSCSRTVERGGPQCGRDAFVAIVVVDDAGIRRSGTLGQFVAGGKFRPGIFFVRWIGRCQECFEIDQRIFASRPRVHAPRRSTPQAMDRNRASLERLAEFHHMRFHEPEEDTDGPEREPETGSGDPAGAGAARPDAGRAAGEA